MVAQIPLGSGYRCDWNAVSKDAKQGVAFENFYLLN